MKALPPSRGRGRKGRCRRRKGRCRWSVMAASRLELNLVRLLCRCEAMAAEKRDPDEWRLEKVGALHGRLELDSLREVPGATAGPRPPPAALATPLRWAPPRPPASSTLVPGAQRVPASSTWAPSVFQPLSPPWLCPLRARWGGRGVPADTHLFSPVRGSPGGHAAGPESPDEVSADGQRASCRRVEAAGGGGQVQ